MIKLIVQEKDNYCNYILEDDNGNKYKVFIELMNTEIVLDIGDIIYMHKELLDRDYKEYSRMYTFGSLGTKYSRDINKDNYVDVIVIYKDNKKYYLQRYYG